MLDVYKAESRYQKAAAREFPSFESALAWLQEECPGGEATYREDDPGVMDYGLRGNRATWWTVRRLPAKEKTMAELFLNVRSRMFRRQRLSTNSCRSGELSMKVSTYPREYL